MTPCGRCPEERRAQLRAQARKRDFHTASIHAHHMRLRSLMPATVLARCATAHTCSLSVRGYAGQGCLIVPVLRLHHLKPHSCHRHVHDWCIPALCDSCPSVLVSSRCCVRPLLPESTTAPSQQYSLCNCPASYTTYLQFWACPARLHPHACCRRKSHVSAFHLCTKACRKLACSVQAWSAMLYMAYRRVWSSRHIMHVSA